MIRKGFSPDVAFSQKRDFLLQCGADRVLIDEGNLADQVKGDSGLKIDKVLELVGTGLISPLIKRTFRLDGIAEAHRFMERNASVGKIVVLT